MEDWLEPLLAAGVASLLTLFDLDRTFYLPRKVEKKILLRVWWWGFILANGVLASLFDLFLRQTEALGGTDPLFAGLGVGLAYLTLIRLKLTTFTVQGKEIPAGLELVYEGAKEFVYKRINRIALEARYEETVRLAAEQSFQELANRAKLRIEQDALLGADEKARLRDWLTGVLKDDVDEGQKKNMLADFILAGRSEP